MAEETSCENKKTGCYGAKVAHDAFDAMDADKKREESVSSDAKAFVEACENDGRDVIETVKFVARKNGIELSGKRPSDTEKADLYDLLREVVDIVVEEFFDDDGEGEDDPDDSGDCPEMPTSKTSPVRKSAVFTYAFSW